MFELSYLRIDEVVWGIYTKINILRHKDVSMEQETNRNEYLKKRTQQKKCGRTKGKKEAE